MIIVTMALHPTGGSFEYVISIAQLAIFVHAVAIASVPVLFLGFLGLSHYLQGARILSASAIVVYGFGLVAVMIAAAINGLATPDFILENFDGSTSEKKE